MDLNRIYRVCFTRYSIKLSTASYLVVTLLKLLQVEFLLRVRGYNAEFIDYVKDGEYMDYFLINFNT